jgi:hypothetical protein
MVLLGSAACLLAALRRETDRAARPPGAGPQLLTGRTRDAASRARSHA